MMAGWFPRPDARISSGLVACAVLVSGCGPQNSYDAVKGDLRDWLVAVGSGDPSAC
jgi:hypothetical protein